VHLGTPRQARTTVLGAAAAAISIGIILGPTLGFIGTVWVPVASFVAFVALYAALVFLTENGSAVRDRFWLVMFWAAAAVAMATLVLVIGLTVISGQPVFGAFDWAGWGTNFLTTDMGITGPLAPLAEGGILHAIVGTLEQITIALLITVPLAIATALFLNEVGGRFARLVRTIVEAMTALPSVVAGLFVYASVIVLFTRQFNGFAASLSICVLMLPIMIRSADVVLRLVPGNLREAGLALGASQWAVVRRVVLPTVRSGLTTAIILGMAHGIGETAPVLLTAGVTNNLNVNPFDGPQISLPLAALEFVKSPQPEMRARGFATAAVLLVVVLILFVIARAIGGQQAGKVSNSGLKRRLARSRRDAVRVSENFDAISSQLASVAERSDGAEAVDLGRLRALRALDGERHRPSETKDTP
jgi:phosphate transport system permease protein